MRIKGKTMISILLKVACNAYIYYVQRERNFRVFVQKEKTMEQVMNHIRGAVHFQLEKLKNGEG